MFIHLYYRNLFVKLRYKTRHVCEPQRIFDVYFKSFTALFYMIERYYSPLVLVFIFFIAGLQTAYGQTDESTRLRGTVLDAEDRSPLPFVTVIIKENGASVLTNDRGMFVFNQLQPGKFTVVVESFGYKIFEQSVTIRQGRTEQANFFLEKSTESLKAVDVLTSRQEARTKVQTARVQLNTKEIKQFSVGGDADVVRAIQVIPGVLTTGDQGTQLYIRGGLPIQNLVLLDNMQIFNPFHSIGFYSVFDADLVQTVDVYSAGFGAEYGSRNSAVMDVRMRDGNRQHLTGKAQASTFAGKLILEGPLGKKDEQGFANTSFLLSAKSSYLDRVAPVLYPYIESQFDGLPFVFNDFYGKLTNTIDGGSKASVFGFRFDDRVSFQPNSTVGWVQTGGGLDMRLIPPGSTTLIDVSFGYSEYSIDASFNDGQDRKSSITGFNGGFDFTSFVGDNDEVKYGIQAIGYGTDYNFVNPVGLRYQRQANSTELGVYMKYRINRNRWIIDPGLRVQYYGSLGETSFEPRIGAKFLVNESIRLKASVGRFSQNLVAALSDREVVNLFYGFLDGNVTVPRNFRDEEITGRLQTAQHAVFGTEIDLNRQLTLTIEGYYKYFGHITNINRNKIFEDITQNLDLPEIQRRDFNVERGTAYGVDFLLQGTWEKYGIWMGYSYAVVNRDDGIIEYFPIFDRRHNLNLLGNYTFGKNDSWVASIRYNFGTGFPFTPTQANYPFLPFTDQFGNPRPTFDPTVENGQLGTVFGDVNSARLPYYHRVDISIDYIWKISNRRRLEINGGITNMLNRENIFYFDRNSFTRVDQLPILPTVGIAYTF